MLWSSLGSELWDSLKWCLKKGYGRRPLLSLLAVLWLLRLKLLLCYCNECRCCHCCVCCYRRCRYSCGCCCSLLLLLLLSQEQLQLLLSRLMINKSIKFRRLQVSFAFHVERWIKTTYHRSTYYVGCGRARCPFLAQALANFGVTSNLLSMYECFWVPV